MNPNIEQLNCLANIVAEEIKKVAGGGLCVEVSDGTSTQSHLTQDGGKVFHVSLRSDLINSWFGLYPSR